MSRRLTRESRGITVADDRGRGSSGGEGCTRNAVPTISCRDLEIDETRCYPETMARPIDEVCTARLWVIIADVTF